MKRFLAALFGTLTYPFKSILVNVVGFGRNVLTYSAVAIFVSIAIFTSPIWVTLMTTIRGVSQGRGFFSSLFHGLKRGLLALAVTPILLLALGAFALVTAIVAPIVYLICGIIDIFRGIYKGAKDGWNYGFRFTLSTVIYSFNSFSLLHGSFLNYYLNNDELNLNNNPVDANNPVNAVPYLYDESFDNEPLLNLSYEPLPPPPGSNDTLFVNEVFHQVNDKVVKPLLGRSEFEGICGPAKAYKNKENLKEKILPRSKLPPEEQQWAIENNLSLRLYQYLDLEERLKLLDEAIDKDKDFEDEIIPDQPIRKPALLFKEYRSDNGFWKVIPASTKVVDYDFHIDWYNRSAINPHTGESLLKPDKYQAEPEKFQVESKKPKAELEKKTRYRMTPYKGMLSCKEMAEFREAIRNGMRDKANPSSFYAKPQSPNPSRNFDPEIFHYPW